MSSFIDEKSQYAPMLGHEDESIDGETPFVYHPDSKWRTRFYYLLVGTISIAALSVGGVIRSLNMPACLVPETPGVRDPYTPVKLSYVNRVLKEDPDSPKFMGKPREELDQAWHDLLDGTLIKFSKEELMLANNATSISHKDGGYVGGLGVSHSLHCLKRIKQYLHPEYYYPGEQNWAELDWHVDHCLDSLRKELLCKASPDVYLLEWTPHSLERPSVTVPQPHMCVDWDALHAWMQSRSAGYDDMVKPTESEWAAMQAKLKEEKKEKEEHGHHT
ncbi:hypothetical protein GGR51DRAFT_575033 [Nemania sp. FL0031]|nr:hypothetical protein GGR51DRAFT_575033 [Nemania sp. FL0031]